MYLNSWNCTAHVGIMCVHIRVMPNFAGSVFTPWCTLNFVHDIAYMILQQKAQAHAYLP